eukprot:scaffold3166_cov399-Prasinococcus_capsulatus_cf.AAC.3
MEDEGGREQRADHGDYLRRPSLKQRRAPSQHETELVALSCKEARRVRDPSAAGKRDRGRPRSVRQSADDTACARARTEADFRAEGGRSASAPVHQLQAAHVVWLGVLVRVSKLVEAAPVDADYDPALGQQSVVLLEALDVLVLALRHPARQPPPLQRSLSLHRAAPATTQRARTPQVPPRRAGRRPTYPQRRPRAPPRRVASPPRRERRAHPPHRSVSRALAKQMPARLATPLAEPATAPDGRAMVASAARRTRRACRYKGSARRRWGVPHRPQWRRRPLARWTTIARVVAVQQERAAASARRTARGGGRMSDRGPRKA